MECFTLHRLFHVCTCGRRCDIYCNRKMVSTTFSLRWPFFKEAARFHTYMTCCLQKHRRGCSIWTGPATSQESYCKMTFLFIQAYKTYTNSIVSCTCVFQCCKLEGHAPQAEVECVAPALRISLGHHRRALAVLGAQAGLNMVSCGNQAAAFEALLGRAGARLAALAEHHARRWSPPRRSAWGA